MILNFSVTYFYSVSLIQSLNYIHLYLLAITNNDIFCTYVLNL